MASSYLRILFAVVLSLFLSVAAGLAQYEVYGSKDGAVILSKTPGKFFTLDIAGSKIRPVSEDATPYPMFSIDDRFLQVLPFGLEEFKGDKAADDEAVLRQYLKYESDYNKVPVEEMHVEVRKLPSGRTLLLWAFVPKQSPKEQVFVGFREKDYVIVLGSAVDGIDTKAAVQGFLLRMASTFYPSDRPMTLKFAEDGSYERK